MFPSQAVKNASVWKKRLDKESKIKIGGLKKFTSKNEALGAISRHVEEFCDWNKKHSAFGNLSPDVMEMILV